MNKFGLNQREEDVLNKTIESLIFITGEPDSLSKVFCFTPTPLGVVIKVTLVAKLNEHKTEITKDITDYDSW